MPKGRGRVAALTRLCHVYTVHSNPVITNHLKEARDPLSAGFALTGNEKKLFVGLKFVISGDWPSPGSL